MNDKNNDTERKEKEESRKNIRLKEGRPVRLTPGYESNKEIW